MRIFLSSRDDLVGNCSRARALCAQSSQSRHHSRTSLFMGNPKFQPRVYIADACKVSTQHTRVTDFYATRSCRPSTPADIPGANIPGANKQCDKLCKPHSQHNQAIVTPLKRGKTSSSRMLKHGVHDSKHPGMTSTLAYFRLWRLQ